MIVFACLFYFALFQCGYGYPTEGLKTEGTSIQNATRFNNFSTSIIQPYNITANKDTRANFTVDAPTLIDHQHNSSVTINISSYHEELQGFVKKVVTKVKGGFNKVKTKVNVGIGKIKSKINDVKNKIGSGGGTKNIGSGGGTGTNKIGGGIGTTHYRRPYNRPTSGGGGSVDPTVLWVLLGLGVAGVLGTILYFMVKR